MGAHAGECRLKGRSMIEQRRLPWLDERALIRKHPRLYHYTKESALLNILASRGLFATHYLHTNDRAEIRALRQPIANHMAARSLQLIRTRLRHGQLKLRQPESELEAKVGEDAEQLFDSMIRSMPVAPHLTCFSSHSGAHQMENGLLTMWRLYGGEGEGVALGFDTKKLVESYEDASAKFGMDYIFLDEVAYGIDDPILQTRLKESESLLGLHSRNLASLLDGKELADSDPDIDDLMKFLVLSTSTKHPDFEDEREVRMVVAPSRNAKRKGKTPLDGPRNRLLISCLEAMEEILVGPGKKQAAIVRAVRAKLKAAGYKHVQVRSSATPFRHS